MTRPTAAVRLRRIVAMLPWIAARPGVPLDEIARQFGLPVEEVEADLEVVFMVGVPPYTPDAMIDVTTEGGRVWVRLGDAFTEPLRLTDSELLAVYLAVGAMADAGDGPITTVLSSAASKLAGALGLAGTERVSVELGDADPVVLGHCREGVEAGRQLELVYYSFTTNQERARRVDPRAVLARDGHWYLWAWCHLAGDDRMFRVDRIRSVTVTAAPISGRVPVEPPEPRPDPMNGPTVWIDVDERQRWILDEFRPLAVEDGAGGRVLVQLAVAGDAWLARLLLRLGPSAVVVERADDPRAMAPAAASAVRSAAVAAIRRRYGD
jgi:proteasome accessory factor C